MPGYNFQKTLYSFYLTNRVDPDEMQSRECSIMLHFLLIFTVCKSFQSGFPEYEGLINVINGFFSDHITLIAPCHKKPWLGTGKILDISA